jgi:hypothetical protein
MSYVEPSRLLSCWVCTEIISLSRWVQSGLIYGKGKRQLSMTLGLPSAIESSTVFESTYDGDNPKSIMDNVGIIIGHVVEGIRTTIKSHLRKLNRFSKSLSGLYQYR